MAELADAYDSGSYGATRAGSSPVRCTTSKIKFPKGSFFLYSLEFSTLPSLEILKNFYELNTPCLKRKYEKYQEILILRK